MTVTPKEVRAMLSFFVILRLCVCHFVISSLSLLRLLYIFVFTGEDVETRNKRNEEQAAYVYMYIYIYMCVCVCLWPIGRVYVHVAHTNINGISLCSRLRIVQTRREQRAREREKNANERKHIVLCLSTDAGRNLEEGERERRGARKISARYTPLRAPVLSIDVSIRCCHCCRRLSWHQ